MPTSTVKWIERLCHGILKVRVRLYFSLTCIIAIIFIMCEVESMMRNERVVHNVTGSVLNPLLPSPLEQASNCLDYRSLNLSFNHTTKTAPSPAAIKQVKKKTFLTSNNFKSVQKFVFFLGYPRSGHSIIGSMMDAHPNMIIAHEYNLFRQWDKILHRQSRKEFLYNSLYQSSVINSMFGWRSESSGIKGYTLGLDYEWQGKFNELRVIGDKSGAVTSQTFSEDPVRFLEMLDELSETVGVPVYVIHVVRNPFDMISTRLLYADGFKKTKLPASEERRHCNNYGLSYHINRTFLQFSIVQEIMDQTNLPVQTLHLADLIRSPQTTVTSICQFLGLPCPEDYLLACKRKTFTAASQTRRLVKWPVDLVQEVYQRTKQYHFLWRYSFQGH